MMSGIEFVDAPPPSPGAGNSLLHRQRVSEFVAALRDRPGEWAIYPYPSTEVSARAAASRISRGKVAAFGAGFQATASRGVVYARYIGVQR